MIVTEVDDVYARSGAPKLALPTYKDDESIYVEMESENGDIDVWYCITCYYYLLVFGSQ